MKRKTLLQNALIVNAENNFKGSVLIDGDKIEKIYHDGDELPKNDVQVLDLSGKLLLPGVIDSHVHFRDPGLTYKGNMTTESMAALAGGVTSFMDMPNTQPQTTTINAFKEKMKYAAKHSFANYSFYLGATNGNIHELLEADYSRICGVKVFLGSSTGNMLVNNPSVLKTIFSKVKSVIAVHAESEEIIKSNKEKLVTKLGKSFPISYHPTIRSAEACFEASSKAIELAKECGTRLHILHLSTAKELSLLEKGPIEDKKITAETCPTYLLFDDSDYEKFGPKIKCNPAVKTKEDKEALIKAVSDDLIDTIGTDHAPHLWNEKQGDCLTSMSGLPSIQFSLLLLLELAYQGKISKEKVVQKMCNAPSTLFNVTKRGFIKEGYFADLVVVNPTANWKLKNEDVISKCGWTPYEGKTFHNKIEKTFVNGNIAYDEKRGVSKKSYARALKFIVE